ncbi:RNA-binding protein Cwf29 [Saitoella coloradoensis]
MNSIRSIQKLNAAQIDLPESASWHADYRDSAYIYVGGLPYDLTEGDIVTIFSQYGEPVDINLVRDKNTGKSKGFAFIKYEDQRSTVLAVDNLTGAKVLGRMLKVDHVSQYKQPKKDGEEDDDDPRPVAMNVAPKHIREQEDARRSRTMSDTPAGIKEDVGDTLAGDLDVDDPMRQYLIEQRRKQLAEAAKERERSEAKGSSGRRHKDEDKTNKDGRRKSHRSRSRDTTRRRDRDRIGERERTSDRDRERRHRSRSPRDESRSSRREDYESKRSERDRREDNRRRERFLKHDRPRGEAKSSSRRRSRSQDEERERTRE